MKRQSLRKITGLTSLAYFAYFASFASLHAAPLTLSMAVHTALQYHPALKAARAAISRDQTVIGQASAAWLPTVTVQGNYARSTANFALTPGSLPSGLTSAVNFESPDSYNSFFGGLNVEQRVFDFGSTDGAVRAAEANVAMSDTTAQRVRAEVVADVLQAYFLALQAQELLKVQQQTKEQYEHHLFQAKEYFKAGTRHKFDVLKAEVDLATQHVNLLKAQNAVNISHRRLQFTMGLTDPLTDTLEASALSATATAVNTDPLLRRALTQRPEILLSRAKARSAEASRQAADAGEKPYVQANGTYYWRGQNFPLVWNWSLGVSVTWPLFTGHLTEHQIREADASLAVAQAEEEAAKQGITLEVEQYALEMKDASDRIRATEKLIDQAQQQLELSKSRYTTGLGPLIEVTDAQVALTNARVGRVQALVEYKLAEAKLAKASGQWTTGDVGFSNTLIK